jgi:hypothetical protein
MQFAAQMAHRGAQQVHGILVLCGTPEFVNQLIMRPNLAGIDGTDFLRFVVTNRYDDSGRRFPLSQMPDDLLTVHIGQTQIEKNQIRPDRLNSLKSLFPVTDWINGVACRGQYDTESLLDRLFVVDNEYPWTSFFHRYRLSRFDPILSFWGRPG